MHLCFTLTFGKRLFICQIVPQITWAGQSWYSVLSENIAMVAAGPPFADASLLLTNILLQDSGHALA